MTLIDLIKQDLSVEDRAVLSKVDLSKSNDEIIGNLTEAQLLKFKKSNYENQKAKQTK